MPKIIKLADGTDFELDEALVRIQDSGTVTLSDDDAVYFQRQLEFIEAQTYVHNEVDCVLPNHWRY
uniref:Uncharacterized protein n=1 Tax=Escherichia phage vB_EcoM_4HA13 TaxID=2601675 RepID=A0A7D0N9N4_9CAUD